MDVEHKCRLQNNSTPTPHPHESLTPKVASAEQWIEKCYLLKISLKFQLI